MRRSLLVAVSFTTAVSASVSWAAQGGVDVEIGKYLSEAEASDPDTGRVLGALRSNFPDQYYGLIRNAADAWRRDGFKADGRQIAAKALQGFVRANTKNIAFAPTSHLVRYAVAKRKLMEVLRDENVRVCARMVVGDRTPTEVITPSIKRATADVSVAMIHAARAGIDSPQSRAIDRLSASDTSAYARALQNLNLTDDVLRAMASETVQYASPAIQCEAGLAHEKAVTALDAESTARITAYTLMP